MKRTLLILALALSATIANAQNDYNDLLLQVASNNLGLKSSIDKMNSELLQLRSENNLPDPEVDFDYKWGQKGAGNRFGGSISQSFDWPGVYRARGKAINNASIATTTLAVSNYVDKMLELKNLFIDIINTKKALALQTKNLNILDSLMSKYQDGARNGEFTRFDLSKIRLSRLTAARAYSSTKAQLEALESSLTSANGGKDCSAIMDKLKDYPQETLLAEQAYTSMVEQHDPLLKYNSYMLQSQSDMARASKLSRMPSFSLGYVYENEEGASFNGFSISMTLPFFSNKHKAKASEMLVKAYNSDMLAVKIDRETAMHADYAKACSLQKRLTEYKSVLDSGEYLDLLKKSLDGGEMSLLDYLREVNYYLDESAQMLSIEYELHQTLARLNRYELISLYDRE